MLPADAILSRSWRAELALDFARRADRTVLATRRHDGPLVVQKPFYPEGETVCHAIVVHPPGGIAGGDELRIDLGVGRDAHALLTTPGAGKWYRSNGARARAQQRFTVAPGATLEWLPQETIVFDGALAELCTEVRLTGDACYLGWEILCLGRIGSGERFRCGACAMMTTLWRDGIPLWVERGRIEGSDSLLDSPVGLAGEPIFATFLAAAPGIDQAVRNRCREQVPEVGEGAVTLLPAGLLVSRFRGPSTEAARRYFMRLWKTLRPAVSGRAAQAPRIWRT
jgi:urease accessory protein